MNRLFIKCVTGISHWRELDEIFPSSTLSLLQEGFIEQFDVQGHTPLHKAALNGQYEVIGWLKENFTNLNVNIRDKRGCTPLYYCCLRGYFKHNFKKSRRRTAEELLKYGANPNIGFEVNSEGDRLNPLHWAVFHGDSETVNILLAQRASQEDPSIGEVRTWKLRWGILKVMAVDVAGFMQHKSIINNFILFAKEIINDVKITKN